MATAALVPAHIKVRRPSSSCLSRPAHSSRSTGWARQRQLVAHGEADRSNSGPACRGSGCEVRTCTAPQLDHMLTSHPGEAYAEPEEGVFWPGFVAARARAVIFQISLCFGRERTQRVLYGRSGAAASHQHHHRPRQYSGRSGHRVDRSQSTAATSLSSPWTHGPVPDYIQSAKIPKKVSWDTTVKSTSSRPGAADAVANAATGPGPLPGLEVEPPYLFGSSAFAEDACLRGMSKSSRRRTLLRSLH